MFLHLGDDTTLRSVVPADGDALFLVIDGHREHLRPWLPWVDQTRVPADTAAFIAMSRENESAGTGLAAILESAGEICGVVGLDSIDRLQRASELGYWLREDCQGRGLMTRAARSLAEYAFETLHLHRLVIRARVDNRPSRAVAERLGFRLEGILRGAERRAGGFVDVALYARLRSDPAPHGGGGP